MGNEQANGLCDGPICLATQRSQARATKTYLHRLIPSLLYVVAMHKSNFSLVEALYVQAVH